MKKYGSLGVCNPKTPASSISMLNILMFIPQFRPCIGGAERQAERLAESLVAAGCRVTVLTPLIDPASPRKEITNGVHIERFPLVDLSRRFRRQGIGLLNFPYILWQVFRVVRPKLKGVDILHTHLASLQTAGAALAGRWAGIPVICKAAVADERSDLGEIEKSRVTGPWVARLARHAIPHWVATTQAVGEALIRADIAAERISHIPNGIDITLHPPVRDFAQGARRFLYLGRLSSNTQRDTPTLIEAFDRLAQEMTDVELALVGGGDLLMATREHVARCKARERIHVPGFEEPVPWLTWADAFVLPSRREGLSNALLEAMASGLACIANDIPPNREVLADGVAGLLVPVEDVGALKDAMQSLAENSDLVAVISKEARTRVMSTYGMESVSESYLSLYQKLINLSK